MDFFGSWGWCFVIVVFGFVVFGRFCFEGHGICVAIKLCASEDCAANKLGASGYSAAIQLGASEDLSGGKEMCMVF